MENLLKQVLELETLVEYADGSVVSKTVIDRKVGTVSVFAFDKGAGLSAHTAPYDALVYISAGAAEITIENDTFNLRQGQFIIMPAGKTHALYASERFKMMLIMIKE